jgi:hypothetical protein
LTLIDDPVELWTVFLGELQVPSNRGIEPVGRDSDLIGPLANSLSLDPDQPIEPQLAGSTITAADLTLAILAVLAPYAQMFTDLLTLFVCAKANSSDSELVVHLELTRDQPAMSFNIEQFGSWQRELRRITELEEAKLWTQDTLWEAASALESAIGPQQQVTGDVERWLSLYDSGEWPDWTPGSTSEDAARPAEFVTALWDVWTSVVNASRQVSVQRRDLDQQQFQVRTSDKVWATRPRPPFDPWTLRNLDRENWARRVLVALDQVDNVVADQPSALENLASIVSELPIGPRPIERQQQVLLEVLRLPFWRYRRELYSAWVSTLIFEALDGIRLLSSRGRFEYRFSGSHLANVAGDGAIPLQVWAELRSALAKPGRGRSKAIQPDYTVLTEPITFAESAVLVVEVKHYGQQNARSFGKALSDYARGRPEAQVVLVNYGPADEASLAQVDAADADRCHVIGNLHPANETAVAEFLAIARHAIPELGVQATPPSQADIPTVTVEKQGETEGAPDDTSGQTEEEEPGRLMSSRTEAGAIVELGWTQGGADDLDLHVRVQAVEGGDWHTINYQTRGSSQASTGWLDRDTRHAPGREVIRVPHIPFRLTVAVHRYSATGTLGGANPHIRFIAERHDVLVRFRDNNNSRDAAWWDVLEFKARPGTVVVHDTVIGTEPDRRNEAS